MPASRAAAEAAVRGTASAVPARHRRADPHAPAADRPGRDTSRRPSSRSSTIRDSPDGHISRDDDLRRQLPGIDVVTVPGCRPGKSAGDSCGRWLSHRSWEYGRYRLRTMAAGAARAGAIERRPQVVHFDDLGVAQLGPLAGPSTSTRRTTSSTASSTGTATVSHGLRRQFARIERRKVSAVEQRVWRTMALSLACSEVDAMQMRRGGARAIVCPNGAGSGAAAAGSNPTPGRAASAPVRRGAQLPAEPARAGMVHRGGAAAAARERWRCRSSSDAVGTPPRGPAAADGVVMHGRVPAVEPYYERAHAVIVPVLFGSGTRLKMVEAMALRPPDRGDGDRCRGACRPLPGSTTSRPTSRRRSPSALVTVARSL